MKERNFWGKSLGLPAGTAKNMSDKLDMLDDNIAPEQVIPDWIVLGKGIGAMICIKEIETEKKNHFERCLL